MPSLDGSKINMVITVDEDGTPVSGGSGGGNISAVATAAPPSYVEGEDEPLSMDLDGNLRVFIDNPIVAGDFNLNEVGGVAVAVGHGVAATALRVELPTDGTGVVNLGATDRAHLAAIETAVEATATNIPPTLPEPLSSTNVVDGVKVNQTGAGTASIKTADADEIWSVLGWSLSFSAACTLTVSMDDDDATKQYVFDIPAAGIWDLDVVDFARFTGNVNEPVGFANSAGNMKGIVYVRKYA